MPDALEAVADDPLRLQPLADGSVDEASTARHNQIVQVEHESAVIRGRAHRPFAERVWVHTLQPFGRCAAEVHEAGPGLAATLLQLHEVCLWAEANASALVRHDEDLRRELEERADLVSDAAMTRQLMLSDGAPPLDELVAGNDLYHDILRERAEQIAVALLCPYPAVAADAWDMLAIAQFYAAGRHEVL